MSETVWRSTADMPRDGTVIAVLSRNSAGSLVADCVRFGVTELDTGLEEAWFDASWVGVIDWAKDFDPKIVGWLPLPQLKEWCTNASLGAVETTVGDALATPVP